MDSTILNSKWACPFILQTSKTVYHIWQPKSLVSKFDSEIDVILRYFPSGCRFEFRFTGSRFSVFASSCCSALFQGPNRWIVWLLEAVSDLNSIRHVTLRVWQTLWYVYYLVFKMWVSFSCSILPVCISCWLGDRCGGLASIGNIKSPLSPGFSFHRKISGVERSVGEGCGRGRAMVLFFHSGR